MSTKPAYHENRQYCPAPLSPTHSRMVLQQPYVTPYAVHEEHFIQAICQGDISGAKYLIEMGVNVNAKTITGNTAAIIAAEYSQIEALFFLLENGCADLSIANKCGFTVMHALAQNGHFDVIEMIGDLYHAPADEKCWDGATPLHLAARNGHAETCKVLVEKLHVNVMLMDMEGRSALYFAAWSKNEEIVRILLDAMNSNPQAQSESASLVLPIAAAFGLTRLVQDLVDHYKAKVNSRDQRHKNSALMLAANHGHLDIVKFLDTRHADLNLRNSCGSTAVILASCEGHTDIIKYLQRRSSRKFIDFKAINVWNFSALDYAYLLKERELIDLLKGAIHCTRALRVDQRIHFKSGNNDSKKNTSYHIKAYRGKQGPNQELKGNLSYRQVSNVHGHSCKSGMQGNPKMNV